MTDFLHRAAVHPNEAVGKVAGQCLLLMVSRRGRVRDMFRNVTTFTSVPAASKTSWADALVARPEHLIRVPLFAPRTLNATGQPRVTLSLR